MRAEWVDDSKRLWRQRMAETLKKMNMKNDKQKKDNEILNECAHTFVAVSIASSDTLIQKTVYRVHATQFTLMSIQRSCCS